MSHLCELRIVSTPPNGSPLAGGEFTGRVEVNVHRDCRVEALKVSVYWTTRGRATSDSGTPITEILVEDESWEAGDLLHFPFAFSMPTGPVSYQGEELTVQWMVEARAQLIGANPLETRAVFSLGTGPLDEPYQTGDPECGERSDLDYRLRAGAPTIGTYLGAAIAAIMVLVGLWIGTMPWWEHLRHFPSSDPRLINYLNWDNFELMLAPGLALSFAGLGAFILYQIFRRQIVRHRLGDFFVEFPRHTVRRGEQLEFSLRLPRDSNALVQAITTELFAEEVVRFDWGDDIRTQTTKVWTSGVIPTIEDMQGQPVHELPDPLTQRFAITEEMPLSFYSVHAEVRWFVEVTVDIRRWPNWSEKIPIDIVLGSPRDIERGDEHLEEPRAEPTQPPASSPPSPAW